MNETTTHDYEEALKKLETSLEMPVVSGELTAWAANVNASADELRGPLAETGRKHQEVFAEIAKEDLELASRLEQLAAEDRDLRDQFGIFHRQVQQLANKAQQVEPNELRAAGETKEVVRHGLDLVIRARKQELAIQTWLSEAFQRDRGVGD